MLQNIFSQRSPLENSVETENSQKGMFFLQGGWTQMVQSVKRALDPEGLETIMIGWNFFQYANQPQFMFQCGIIFGYI